MTKQKYREKAKGPKRLETPGRHGNLRKKEKLLSFQSLSLGVSRGLRTQRIYDEQKERKQAHRESSARVKSRWEEKYWGEGGP